MKKFLLIIIATTFIHGLTAKDFVWFDGEQPIAYSITESPASVVNEALKMFGEDLTAVTGMAPQEVAANKAVIQITQLDKAPEQARRLASAGVPVDKLKKSKDAFFIGVKGNKLLVVGSDARGTAYGVLELSRMAGVSPWVWWGDSTPIRKDRLTVDNKFSTFQSPSVEFRGIFINDEDWSTQPWSFRNFEPSDTPGEIGVKTYKEIFKLLLRLRANIIWPGMHDSTVPFYFVEGLKETADSLGIVIGTSHCEPLMRNNVGEWNIKERGAYNYISNKEGVQNYWIERLKEAGQYENMYTLGMRGIHDSYMEGVNTLEERTEALQQVILDQRELLKEYVNEDLSQIPQTFVPYKEVLQIMENGVDIPEDVTLVWCDDNYGYITRLSDEEQQKRSGGGGVYYHLSYWGRPHDYLWLTTTQPGLIYSEMKNAYDKNARKLWIANVHDPKPAAYDLELFLDMAWNINSVSPSTLQDHLSQWLCREFGEEAGEKLLPAMLDFYRLCGIRKPEHMGWSQVEVGNINRGGIKVTRGWSPIAETDFSLNEFGGELDRYLSDYRAIKSVVAEAEKFIPQERKETFFSFVKYPVFSAAAMSTKILEAQRARSLASGATRATRYTLQDAVMTACAKSSAAYTEIRNLTDYYNNRLDGKWRYSMSMNPRDLFVFYPPTLPIGLTEKEVAQYKDATDIEVKSLKEVADGSYVAKNACEYTRADEGVYTIQSLGHSMNAVSLPKGKSITFEFDLLADGDAILRTAVIPVHPSNKGDLRFSVSIDGQEPIVCSFMEEFIQRTDNWKQNVLRGQAREETRHTLTKGHHTLTITALDDHVIVDQWMLDFKPNRQFYVFPLDPAYKN